MVNSPAAPRSGEASRADDRPPPGDGRVHPRREHGAPVPPSGGTQGSRLGALDGLRFLAAASVLMFHFNNRGHYPALFPVTSYLWTGVELFFMISGFVICMSAWGKGPGRFATSRIVRLFPAYWFAIVLTTVVTYVFDDVFKPLGYRDILVNFTMLQTPFGAPAVQGVFWTLWPELKFYLLFSVMVWWGLTYRRAVAFCALWLLGTAVAFGTRSGFLSEVLTARYSCFFVAGILLYLMRRFGPNTLIWLLLGLTYLIAIYQSPTHNIFQRVMQQPYWPVGVLYTGFYAVLVLLALGKLDWMRWRALTTLGAMTYPLYLVHEQLGLGFLQVMRGRLEPYPLLLTTVALMVTLAWLIHRFVERPASGPLRRGLERSLHAIEQAGEQRSVGTAGEPGHRPRTDRATQSYLPDGWCGRRSSTPPGHVPMPYRGLSTPPSAR